MMMNRLSTKHAWWLLVAVALIWFANLEYRTLIKPDEGRYAEIPREMVASGDWVTPRLNELKYFEKPPLQYWATAAAYTLFGEHQWTSRLWTGLTGFAGILLVWFAGLRLFGREAAGYAALLLSSSLLYVLMGHINTLDMGVTFFLTLGIVGLLLGQAQADRKKQRNWMMLAWAGLALAVLSKGLMGLVLPGAALFIYCVVQRDFGVLKRMHWLPGLAVFFVITVPWFVLVMKANPEFFERFFIYEHYTRFTTKDLGRYQPWYYFIPILLAGALPWTVLMFDTMFRTLRNSGLPDKMFNTRRFLRVLFRFRLQAAILFAADVPRFGVADGQAHRRNARAGAVLADHAGSAGRAVAAGSGAECGQVRRYAESGRAVSAIRRVAGCSCFGFAGRFAGGDAAVVARKEIRCGGSAGAECPVVRPNRDVRL
jgi:4-amino-4-deoxy-L-arabinose transferase-like glycosyltransferase